MCLEALAYLQGSKLLRFYKNTVCEASLNNAAAGVLLKDKCFCFSTYIIFVFRVTCQTGNCLTFILLHL